MFSPSSFRIPLFYALLLLISLGLCAGIGELMVRLFIPESMSRPTVNVYQAVEPPLNYTYKRNFDGLAFRNNLQTNGLGFRGPDWTEKKKPGYYRIVLIGDSHAMGYGVSFEESVGEQLARQLRQSAKTKDVEVLNFAINGYNSDQELHVLQHYGLSYDPDLILVIASSNDDEPAMLIDDQGLFHWQNSGSAFFVFRASIRRALHWMSQRSRLVHYLLFLRKLYALEAEQRLVEKDPVHVDETIQWMGDFEAGAVLPELHERVYEPLQAMIHLAKKRGIPIVVASFNARIEYRRLFQHLAKSEKIPSLELLSLFPETDSWVDLQQQFGLGWDDHLNAIAHQRWGSALSDLIIQHELISENQNP